MVARRIIELNENLTGGFADARPQIKESAAKWPRPTRDDLAQIHRHIEGNTLARVWMADGVEFARILRFMLGKPSRQSIGVFQRKYMGGADRQTAQFMAAYLEASLETPTTL